jgi:hypothetical protein
MILQRLQEDEHFLPAGRNVTPARAGKGRDW